MKNITTLLCVLTLAFALVGCGQSETKEAATTEAVVTEEAVSTEAATTETVEESAADVPESAPYLKETGWTYVDGVIKVAAVVGNTDTVNCYVLMPLTVTAKAADGSILGVSNLTVTWVAPNDVMPVASYITDVSQEPAEVTFDFSYDEGSVPGNDYTLADIPVTNITDTGTKVTAEYQNNTGVDFPNGMTYYALFYKGGKLVAGSDYSLDMAEAPNGSSKAFEIDYQFDSPVEHDSVVVYAVPNLL